MSVLNPLSGQGYSFWSGVGNDIPIFFLGFLPAWWHNHKCHYPRCWRLGRYPFHHYKLCCHHHPDVPADIPLHIAKLHKEAKNAR